MVKIGGGSDFHPNRFGNSRNRPYQAMPGMAMRINQAGTNPDGPVVFNPQRAISYVAAGRIQGDGSAVGEQSGGYGRGKPGRNCVDPGARCELCAEYLASSRSNCGRARSYSKVIGNAVISPFIKSVATV